MNLEQRLVLDIMSRLYFDPYLLGFLLQDLKKRGKIKDSRRGIRVVNFSKLDYAPTRTHL